MLSPLHNSKHSEITKEKSQGITYSQNNGFTTIWLIHLRCITLYKNASVPDDSSEEDKEKEEVAAVKIQAAFRGHIAREEVKKMKTDSLQNEENEEKEENNSFISGASLPFLALSLYQALQQRFTQVISTQTQAVGPRVNCSTEPLLHVSYSEPMLKDVIQDKLFSCWSQKTNRKTQHSRKNRGMLSANKYPPQCFNHHMASHYTAFVNYSSKPKMREVSRLRGRKMKQHVRAKKLKPAGSNVIITKISGATTLITSLFDKRLLTLQDH
ncbi:hypothetical protein P7K49_021029 [Saguinus oedipus]|uniref:Abnormal spindle-like microcephaly-associated protein n=1 Tax=Saguinus oedipus TaxID=9490 RepID=A0ABQ9US66_SAGOE|nr:hypothetical protein P7K49_021029 [Saguinus oedipus]